MTSPTIRKILPFAVVIALGCGVWLAGITRLVTGPSSGVVVVVSGAAGRTARDPPRMRPAIGKIADGAGASATREAIARRYPVLKDVTFACTGDKCALIGSLTPAASDEERRQREDMLLGGLERLMASLDHPGTAAIQLDEIGDDAYILRLTTR